MDSKPLNLQERLASVFPDPLPRGLMAEIAEVCSVSRPTVSNWFNNPEKVATISRKHAELLNGHFHLGVSIPWLAEGEGKRVDSTRPSTGPLPPAGLRQRHLPSAAPHEAPASDGGSDPDLVITQYEDTGGAMGHGFNLTDHPPGHIKSWKVTHEWLRLNVPNHTGVKNLAIVTGFGPSMKPMFNPGDPLLVDVGVKVIDHEGVYFFRVGDEGFIKLIQRVPEFDGPGVRLRVISKNPDYPPYDLSPKNPHFEVLGKVLTVWRSEQF